MGGSESRRSAGSGDAAKRRGGEETRDPERDELAQRTRPQLLALAKQLGLAGVSKLKKDELVERLRQATAGRAPGDKPTPVKVVGATPAARAAKPGGAGGLRPVVPVETSATSATAREPAPAPAAAPPPARAPEPLATDPDGGTQDPGNEPAATAKLDLGPAAAAAEKEQAQIPWSYGLDRVTAAAIDPARLFVYWEVTDPAVARARAGLGEGGPGAWLNLRVYDTTGRIFDGTNAHSYFDQGLSREERQWFFQIGKPTSTTYVEIGMKSAAGHFVRIARSGRVDFPRAEPVAADAPEWLTVRVATGEAVPAGRGGGQGPRPGAGGPGGAGAPGAPGGAIPVFDLGTLSAGAEGFERRIWELLHGDGHRVEWQQLLGGAGWFQLEGRVEWEGPVLVTSWEAGPFAYPVSVDPPSREAWEGQSFAFRVGDVTHVVYGPWQVVIRNLGAFSERAEIGRWEVFRSWVATAGREVQVAVPAAAALRPGASETLGASERRWLSGSELRLGGASEVFRLGASEVRMRGASETLFAGASQWVQRGASERRLGGASETRLRGASEQRLGGASERLLGGGSESRLGGASEGRLGGGSEGRLGGSEQRLAGAAEGGRAAPALGYPKVEE